jgi:hypothetical protein
VVSWRSRGDRLHVPVAVRTLLTWSRTRLSSFLHILGVIGVFVGYGALLLATTALGRARKIEEVRVIAGALTAGRRIGFEQISVINVIVVVAVLLVGITGLDMARYTGDWHSGWVPVAIVSLLLLAPVGPLIINL